MYRNNSLQDVADDLKQYNDIELENSYKTELFRTYLNGAISSLEKAGELAGGIILPSDRNCGHCDKMVSLLIIVGFIFIMFKIV